MKENKAANSNNNNKAVDALRNSDIISIERTNNMNNIDLNTITVAEAKAAGIAGMDLLTVLRNPVNSVVTKKNEEFAADLKAKTEKKKPVRVKKTAKYNGSAKGLTKRLKWNGSDNKLVKFFSSMSDLLGKNFLDWNSDSDYKDAVITTVEDTFKLIDQDEAQQDHLFVKGNVWVSNLKLAIRYAQSGDTNTEWDSTNFFRIAQKNAVVSATEAGLIGAGESEDVLNYLEGVMVK